MTDFVPSLISVTLLQMWSGYTQTTDIIYIVQTK